MRVIDKLFVSLDRESCVPFKATSSSDLRMRVAEPREFVHQRSHRNHLLSQRSLFTEGFGNITLMFIIQVLGHLFDVLTLTFPETDFINTSLNLIKA